jgi:hypothetical protein
MSVLLVNQRAGKLMWFHEHGWAHALSLALQNGWSPLGVTACHPSDSLPDLEDLHLPDAVRIAPQDGQQAAEGLSAMERSLANVQAPVRATAHGASYFDADEGWVTAEDAAALGKSLAQALPDIPRHEAAQDKTYTSSLLPGLQLFDFNTPMNAVEWFSGRKRQVLKDLIALCRLGGFVIQRR